MPQPTSRRPRAKRSTPPPPAAPATPSQSLDERSKAERDKRRLATAERRARILELRIRGQSLARIAKTVGISVQSVHRHISKAIDRRARELASELLEVELMRLDEMQEGLWLDATTGEWRSVEAVLQIMARRAKLLGLDAPTKTTTEVSGPGGGAVALTVTDLEAMSDEELEAIARGAA